MGIRDFIRDEIFAGPMQKHGVLVVYDPDKRYRDICLSMATDRVAIVDTGGSSIESRDAAMKGLGEVAATVSKPRELLIYIPKRRPMTDEEKQMDPFSAYGAFGAVFPDGDGHEYQSLCLRASPDQTTEIRRLFAETPSPSFDVIDSVGGGMKWPTLRAVLVADSARNILLALMVPSQKQKDNLHGNAGWVPEAKSLFDAALKLKLRTKGKTWSSVAEELWSYLLFSEFRFDLPGEPPTAIDNIPHAPEAARPLVEDLCDSLRSDARFRQEYVERAAAIETDLGLPGACVGVSDLGARDTFPFEERTFLSRAVRAFREDRLDEVRDIVARHGASVWADMAESQSQWDLLRSALALAEACSDAERQLPDHIHDMNALIDFYVSGLRRTDQLQRELEQTVGEQVALESPIADAVEHARGWYSRLVGKVQPIFTKHLQVAGWPAAGRPSNGDVFDRHVAPLLKESGRRVGYILVDALRYELGVALFGQLGDGDSAEIIAACAQLPTVTPVGMASLLPGAAVGLRLSTVEGGGIVPMLDGTKLANVNQRMDVLRSRYGDRFAERTLTAFVTDRGKVPVHDAVSLLVLRDTDIDNHLEANPETSLGQLRQTLGRIRFAIRKLKDAGFHDVVIATDHGFFLNAHAGAGDVCHKPPGTWTDMHGRSLLGAGAGDAANFALPAEKAGVRGDFHMFAGPRTMAPYRQGVAYFHGGASLQEAIVPVIVVRLKKEKQTGKATPTIVLSYRGGVKKITTRVPVVEVSVVGADLFSRTEDIEVLLEARDKKGDVVGEPKLGGAVNAATRTISLHPGQKERVTIRMALEFEGKFTLKALNPTTLSTYSVLDMETDYV